MNRTFLFSIFGLGVFSAASFAGSRAYTASVATCTSTSGGAPVVVVTGPDGQRLVANCVSVAVCDPEAKGGGATAYTFTAQGSGAGASSAPRASAPETVYSLDSRSTSSNPLGRILATRSEEPAGLAGIGPETSAIGVDDEAAESWRADLEQALGEARERLSENQDEARDAWQRAAEEARAAQERAREAYDQAMETYRDAMRKAQERSREVQERVTAERLAESDRGARVWTRSRARGASGADTGHDAALEARIEKLEAAARSRGMDVNGADRSLEERVQQLEKLMTSEKASILPGLFGRVRGEIAATAPRVLRVTPPRPPRGPVAPVEPTAPVPPVAATPRRAFPGFDNLLFRRGQADTVPPAAPEALHAGERAQLEQAMNDLKQQASRLREELTRLRTQIERLPPDAGSR